MDTSRESAGGPGVSRCSASTTGSVESDAVRELRAAVELAQQTADQVAVMNASALRLLRASPTAVDLREVEVLIGTAHERATYLREYADGLTTAYPAPALSNKPEHPASVAADARPAPDADRRAAGVMFSCIGSLALTLSDLLVDSLEQAGDASTGVAAAIELAKNVGHIADRASRACGNSQVLGDADRWSFAPVELDALQALSRREAAPEARR